MRGYHNVKKEDVVYIAALLLKAEIQEHRHFSHKQLYPILQHFIPRDMIKTAKKSEWCKVVRKQYWIFLKFILKSENSHNTIFLYDI